MYLNYNYIACHYSCEECFGPYDTNCIKCSSDLSYRTLTQTKTCICEDGYFPIFGMKECSKCDQSCRTCVELTKCTSCYSSMQ